MADFTFLHPVWLIALLPLGLLLSWLKGKQHSNGLIAAHLAEKLGLDQKQTATAFVPLLGLCWLLSVLALAGPSWEKATLPAYSISGARVLVMDMSRSMYATDITPNRLTQARYKALDMLPGWKEGSTGLVTYAADGYVVSPLTQDSSTLSSLIPHLSPEIMPLQGSNAAAGVEEAITLLKQAGHQQGDIILITDGLSEQESSATQDLLANTRFRLSILAVGSRQGAPVRMPDGRLLTNSQGDTVVAKVELDTLLPLVKQTGGQLQLSQPTNRDVDSLVAATAKPMDHADKEKEKELVERVNNGFWLLIPLVILSLFGFRRGIVLAAVLVFMPVDQAMASPWKNRDQLGYDAYQQESYASAAEQFSSPQWKGIAQYKAGNYEQAIDTLKPLGDITSRYNLGNAYARTGEFEKALESYQSVLDQDSQHTDARKNLEIVKQALEQQQPDENKDSDQEPSNEQQKNQQNQQNDDDSENSDSQQSDDSQQASEQQSETEKSAQNQPHQQPDSQPQGENQESDELNDVQQASSGQLQDETEEQPEDPQQAEQSLNKQTQGALSASDPVLKKLEQVPDDTSALIRAQLLLQARQKQAPQATENSW